METPSEGGGWSAEEVPSERTAGRQQGQLGKAQQGRETWRGGGGDTGILRTEAAPGEPGPGSAPVRMELSELQAQRREARAGGGQEQSQRQLGALSWAGLAAWALLPVHWDPTGGFRQG